MAVAWQCAAGYDPSAEAGTQFAFAAVLPEGYALAEGVSLPQILVTLTPPLANAMLMAAGILDSGEGWTLSDDGTLTVKGDDVKSRRHSFRHLERRQEHRSGRECEASLCNEGISFSGSITVLQWGSFYNYANLSGDVTVLEWGHFWNKGPVGKISGGTISGQGGQ